MRGFRIPRIQDLAIPPDRLHGSTQKNANIRPLARFESTITESVRLDLDRAATRISKN